MEGEESQKRLALRTKKTCHERGGGDGEKTRWTDEEDNMVCQEKRWNNLIWSVKVEKNSRKSYRLSSRKEKKEMERGVG